MVSVNVLPVGGGRSFTIRATTNVQVHLLAGPRLVRAPRVSDSDVLSDGRLTG